MRWRKLGLLWAPDGSLPWARSHAMLPTPLRLPDGGLRLLLASCDATTVSRIGWIDIAPGDPRRVIAVARRPVLDIGEPGCFDDNGVNPSSALVMPDGSIQLYYVGYQLQTKVPYTLFTGLCTAATPRDDFARVSPTPVLDRGPDEPFFRTAAFVQPRAGGGWEAWYIGGGEFVRAEGRIQPRYSLCHAISDNGVSWPSAGRIVLQPQPGELGFGRPWLVRWGAAEWRIFYSVRLPRGYTLGFASSADGVSWQRRDDEVGIGISDDGWDGEMICYAAIERLGGEIYMFYNGNGYGRTGVGLAVLERD